MLGIRIIRSGSSSSKLDVNNHHKLTGQPPPKTTMDETQSLPTTYPNRAQIEALAESLEFQLSVLYPDGPGPPLSKKGNLKDTKDTNNPFSSSGAATITNECSSPVNEAQLRDMVRQTFIPRSGISNIDTESFRQAFMMAVERWNDDSRVRAGGGPAVNDDDSAPPNLSTGTAKSFSILDQLLGGNNGGGGLEIPIRFEDISEAASANDRLLLYEKIKYLEDLQMEWDQIRVVLCHDMTLKKPQRQPSSQIFDEVNDDQIDVVKTLISLHRKWFDEGSKSSSGEYATLMHGLCQNIMEVLLTTIADVDDEDQQDKLIEQQQRDVVSSLVQTWHGMWVDLMKHSRGGHQYMAELAYETEVGMMMLLLKNGQTASLASYANETLALEDSCCHWFQCWLSHIPPQGQDRIIYLLVETNVLSSCWERMMHFIEKRKNSQADIVGVASWSSSLSPDASEVQAFSTFCICLHRLRFACFPWRSVLNHPTGNVHTSKFNSWKTVSGKIQTEISANDEKEEYTAAELNPIVDEIFNAIACALNVADHYADSNWKRVLLNGLDAILWGTKSMDLDFHRRWNSVVDLIQKQTTSDTNGKRFLQGLQKDGIL